MHSFSATQHLISRLTLLGDNARESAAFKRICLEAADRLRLLQTSLGDLLDDVQYVEHVCNDDFCPIMRARQIYCIGEGVNGSL